MVDVLTDCSAEEAAWIAGCRRNDPRSQEQLFRQFYPYVMGICLRYATSRSQAQEMVNDSFLKVFEYLRQHPADLLVFRAWLRRLTVNTALNYIRSQKRYPAHDSLDALDTAPDAGDDVINRLTAEQMLALLAELPDDWRMIFNLYEIEGYSHDEISMMLTMPTSTSRTYLTRARQRLRLLIQQRFS